MEKCEDLASAERRLRKLALSNNGVKSQLRDHALKLRVLTERAHRDFADMRDLNAKIADAHDRIDELGEDFERALAPDGDLKELYDRVKDLEYGIILIVCSATTAAFIMTILKLMA